MKTVRAYALTFATLAVILNFTMGRSWWTVASAALTSAVLLGAYLNLKAACSPYAAIGTIALLYWGLSYASNIIEAVYFHVIPLRLGLKGVVAGAVISILVACSLQFGPAVRPANAAFVRIAGGLWWRVLLLVVVFIFVYVVAGAVVYPWISAFYQGRPLPTLPQLVNLQVFRGLFDLACVYPWLRLYSGTRGKAAPLLMAIFTVLCGWGPLLLPNTFLPPQIRFAHAMEMGGSNLLFGAVVAWVLFKPARVAE